MHLSRRDRWSAALVLMGAGLAQGCTLDQHRPATVAQATQPLSVVRADDGFVIRVIAPRVPASFAEVAPRSDSIALPGLPTAALRERRRVEIEGAGLSASEYLVSVLSDAALDERVFLSPALGAQIFAVTLDRFALKSGEIARLIVIRRGEVQ